MVNVTTLREAAGLAVSNGSLRGVAREIGISAPGLSSFLDGASPRNETIRKLREWYVRRCPPPGAPLEVVRSALDLLLDAVPVSRRTAIERQILDSIAHAHQRGDTLPPAWLKELHEASDGAASRSPPELCTRSALAEDEEKFLADADAPSYLSLYSRHRDTVRRELEGAGLTPMDAEARVGLVFLRMTQMREQVDRTNPLVDTLRKLARAVAQSRECAAE